MPIKASRGYRDRPADPHRPTQSGPHVHSQWYKCVHKYDICTEKWVSALFRLLSPHPRSTCIRQTHSPRHRDANRTGPPGYHRTHKQHAYTRIQPPRGRYFLCTCTHNLCMQIGFSERSNPLLTFIKTKQRWADTAFWLGGCVFAAM